ncbi:Pathoproteinsis-related thaumatin superfamily protein isoform 2 [Hibiscus syriacus]|uniref:Pathoproteinsis-related thaumatin superfamily protein isoform 2 n=1 Tax=Hibiscus syriacus TaxID=106335 RepID=A0A6A2ZHQ0_HIBSY|nr:Pathoproteinsis-related thaumatin superfamily protein isoform 2 [Hibiscus syriacus]
MDLYPISSLALILYLIVLTVNSKGVLGASFTFVNRCTYTVWPGILANAGSPALDRTGFELPKDSSRSFQAPTGWSGDCGSGQMECNRLGAALPVTLAEFTLGTGGQDFYDVSLRDGYNIPMVVEGTGGSGLCSSTGCTTDLTVNARRSSGRAACPISYSYAYDDATSTFTCTGADYGHLLSLFSASNLREMLPSHGCYPNHRLNITRNRDRTWVNFFWMDIDIRVMDNLVLVQALGLDQDKP